MDVAHKIHVKLEKILNRLKVLRIIESFKLEINFCQIEDDLKTSLVAIDSVLRKCLHKIINKPRRAEIRNIITELVRKKNLSGVSEDQIDGSYLERESQELFKKKYLKSKKFKHRGESEIDLFIQKRTLKKARKYLCEMCGYVFPDVFTWKYHKPDCEFSYAQLAIDRTDLPTTTLPLAEDHLIENQTCGAVELPSTKDQEEQPNSSYEKIKAEVRVRGKKEGKFTCGCGRNFRLLKSLRKHENVKHSAKIITHSCTICTKSFEERGKLNRHLLSHKVRQYDCSFCSKRFVRSDTLKRHLSLVHSSPKEFPCGFCHKKFNLKYNKNVHEENSHKKVNSWIQCEQCGQKCRNKITFKSHLKIHTGERITCKICGKSFVRKSQYRNHTKNKHFGVCADRTEPSAGPELRKSPN